MWVSKYLRPRDIAILGLMCNVIVQMYQLLFKYTISAGIIAPMPPNKKWRAVLLSIYLFPYQSLLLHGCGFVVLECLTQLVAHAALDVTLHGADKAANSLR